MAELSTLRGQPQACLACPLGSLRGCQNAACRQENILALLVGAARDPRCEGTGLECSMQQHVLGVPAGAWLSSRAWCGLGWPSCVPPLPKSLLCLAGWVLGRAVAQGSSLSRGEDRQGHSAASSRCIAGTAAAPCLLGGCSRGRRRAAEVGGCTDKGPPPPPSPWDDGIPRWAVPAPLPAPWHGVPVALDGWPCHPGHSPQPAPWDQRG